MDEQKNQLRYELLDRICSSVCAGDEFQALRFVRQRNELGLPGMISDELIEWKYNLIVSGTLITKSLHDIGVSNFLLDKVTSSFVQRIFLASDQAECKIISEEMAIQYCQLNASEKNMGYSMLIQTVLQEIDRDLSQPLTLQHLSLTLNVNRSYLSSQFHKEIGVTLTEYVTAKRINYAADMLLNTQLPIKTISKKAGIADVQYFSRLFKKRIGCTPSKYRSQTNPGAE